MLSSSERARRQAAQAVSERRQQRRHFLLLRGARMANAIGQERSHASERLALHAAQVRALLTAGRRRR